MPGPTDCPGCPGRADGSDIGVISSRQFADRDDQVNVVLGLLDGDFVAAIRWLWLNYS